MTRPRAPGPIAQLGAAAALLLLGASCATTPPPPLPVPPPPEAPVPALPEPLPDVAPCRHVERIEVRKGERRLRAHCEGGAVVELVVALGRDDTGPKLRAGDWRTPEGRYRIAGPARPSRFHLFLPIDYPSVEDAERALAEGRLSRADHRRILDAHARGARPPADTALGGDLGFHGEGERWRGDSLHLDWTYGCVALSDPDLDFLVERVDPETIVEIAP